MLSAAPSTADRSGSRCSVSGVGRQIRMASTARSASHEVVARTVPFATSGARRSEDTSSM